MLNDVLHNIISDAVMKVHRDEKLLRMQSAAIQAQQAAEKNNTEEIKSDGTQSTTKPGASIAEDGKIYLRGNPLATTTTITCPNCQLPRLLSYPADPKTEYCAKRPYHSTPNHDIHGNPFPNDKPTKSKPTKDASNANSTTTKKAASADTPPSSSPPSSNSPPNENAKKTTSIPVPSFPTTKCPNCPRYLIVTRIAQHLEKCMGIAGRQSSRNAMAKISTDTPKDSRAGTPRPGKTVGAGNKVGDREKMAGDKAGAGKTVKAADKEKPKKRKLKAEDKDGEEETPKKKKKVLLKKRGAEKTLPPKGDRGGARLAKGDGGGEKMVKVANGETKVREEEGKENERGGEKMAKVANGETKVGEEPRKEKEREKEKESRET